MFIVRHKTTKFDGTAAAIQCGKPFFCSSWLVRRESLTTSMLRLAGYGGFAISANPFFSPVILTFMQTYNVILAVPNIRGGGEFGGEWHRLGRREHKVCGLWPLSWIPGVTWTFLIGKYFWWLHRCCVCPPLFYCRDSADSRRPFPTQVNFSSKTSTRAQARWPSPVHLMAVNWLCFLLSSGYSPHDGEIGFLVCGSVVRAPEGTFGAAIAEGGVADLLKVIGLSHNILIRFLISVSQFHKFTGGELSLVILLCSMLIRLNTSSGKAWTSEYGDPLNQDDFDFIHPLSPVHNVPTDKVLPATLLMINAGKWQSRAHIC